MKIYGSLLSTNTLRSLVTAAELRAPVEFERVDLANKEDRAKLGAINPNNKVPVLVDGEFVLWESNAIDEYLCDITPGQTLLPSEPRAKAEVHRWMYWITAHFAQACGGLNFERMVKKFMNLGEADPNAVARHEQVFHQFAKVVDAHLAGRSWLANDRLSLADIALTAYLEHAERAAYPLASYANLVAHRARVRELPSWRATLG